jgi:hypothetical protein
MTEEMTIIALLAICLIGMLILGVEAKEIALAIGSGLVGYLKGKGDSK